MAFGLSVNLHLALSLSLSLCLSVCLCVYALTRGQSVLLHPRGNDKSADTHPLGSLPLPGEDSDRTTTNPPEPPEGKTERVGGACARKMSPDWLI